MPALLQQTENGAVILTFGEQGDFPVPEYGVQRKFWFAMTQKGTNWEFRGKPGAVLELNREDFNIVMLHGQDSVRPGEELIALPLLRNKSIRYLALGHIHSYKCEKLDLDGRYCYCGCLEGRGFDECGEKGFVLLDINGDRLSSEFIPFAYRKMHLTLLRGILFILTNLCGIGTHRAIWKNCADKKSPVLCVCTFRYPRQLR